jgi:hypothetical protein
MVNVDLTAGAAHPAIGALVPSSMNNFLISIAAHKGAVRAGKGE